MKISDYLIKFIHKKMKIDTVFTFSGGSIIHLLTSLYDYKKVKNIIVHHEQTAAFAAESFSKCTGNIGVAMATSGPGATNLITGIGSCYFDSTPALFITGQVNTYEFKGLKNIRQLGFQETDIVPIVKPITKYAKRIDDPATIRFELEKAYHIAKSGRPGPVLLDIPMNIQRSKINVNKLKKYSDKSEKKSIISKKKFDKIFKLLISAERPVILAGGGIRISNTSKELSLFAKKFNIPVTTTMPGIDCIPRTSDFWAGYVGAYGNRFANFTVANSDLLVVLGSRLTSRQTGTNVKNFARAAKIVHVDIDPNEINNRIKVDVPVNTDLLEFFKIFNGKKINKNITDRKLWFTHIKKLKQDYPIFDNFKNGLTPNDVIYYISKKIKSKAIITSDIGQNQIWLSQSFCLKSGQRLLVSPGMGAMGCSLPAAIGACFVKGNKQIFSFNGDGGFQINIQELHTIKRYNLPVKIFILNNNSLGMIRQFQDLYFDSKHIGSKIDYYAPDFLGIAKAYRIKTFSIKTKKDLFVYTDKIIKYPAACVVQVSVSEKQNAEPKLEVNKPIEDQNPQLPRKEFYNNLLIEPYKE